MRTFSYIHFSSRWSKLKDALIDNRSKLGEAQTLQQFSRDADEMENWLQEKLQIASDESYKDPANIQNKHQKHQGFEAELAANADRLQALLGTGQGTSNFDLILLTRWIKPNKQPASQILEREGKSS